MIRSRTSLRRALATTAAAVLGLGGAVAISAPASAHAASIDASYDCDPSQGKRIVEWELTNDFEATATVTKLQTTPAPLKNDKGEDITSGATIPQREEKNGKLTDGVLQARQILPGDASSATVSFTSEWAEDKFVGEKTSKTITFDGTCVPAEEACVKAADASFTHEFVVKGEESTARVKLDDGVNLCAGEPVTLVSYFAPRPEFSTPQYTYAFDSKVIDNSNRTVDLKVDVPDCNTQVDLFFGGEKDIIKELVDNGPRYGNKKLGTGSGLGGRSTGPRGAVNGGNKACQQPTVEPVSACDGTLTLKLSNTGKISAYPVEFAVTAGSFTRKVTVAAGKGDSVTVPAGSGEATVTADGLKTETYTWAQAENCELPGVIVESDCDTVVITVENPAGTKPVTAKIVYGGETETVEVKADEAVEVTFDRSDATVATIDFPGLDVEPIKATIEDQDCDGGNGGGGNGDGGNGDGGGNGGGDDGNGDGGGLPLTGPAAAGIAGGAGVLLALGAVLFFLARRRRVTFTV